MTPRRPSDSKQQMIEDLLRAVRACALADWQIPEEVLEAQCIAMDVLELYGLDVEG